MIYPDIPLKNAWDASIALILLITCSVTPMHIAFYEENEYGPWHTINFVFDVLFAMDIIASFLSAFHDEDFILIDNPKLIAINYIKTWFIIDVTAIFPFSIF